MEWTQNQIDNFSTAEQLLYNANQNWTQEQINNFSTTEMLIYELMINSSGNDDKYVSLNDQRIPDWDNTVRRFRHGIHSCKPNFYYYYDAINSQAWGGPILNNASELGYKENGWNGYWTVAIPTVGDKIKIRGFFFSSFESTNQGIYTVLRATGSPSIDSQDAWYRMWTEKEIPQSKIDILNGISFGGYNPGITSSSPANISVDSTNYYKIGDIVSLSISLSFIGLDTGGNDTVLSISLPFLSSYLDQHFNAQYSFSDNNAFSNVIIQKTKTSSFDVSFVSTLESNKLELSIKYRI